MDVVARMNGFIVPFFVVVAVFEKDFMSDE
jgi:hypothetical protein